MNKIFTNPIFTFHNCLLMCTKPKGFAQDSFLRKKISDYYFSRLVPNFYYETLLSWKYSPYVVSSRVLFTITGSFGLYYFVIYRKLKSEQLNTKKYAFNLYSTPYLEYEKELLKYEKRTAKRMIC